MQISILESFTDKKIEPTQIRIFELFAGYGSQSLALDLLNIDYVSVGYAEIDKYAIQAHEALHGAHIKNCGDVTKLEVDKLPDMDLLTYSFPCQDISVAGKGRGLAKDSGTRSSLLWECERIIEGKRPRFLMMENVKNLIGKQNKPHFDEWVQVLEGYGYNNYWKVVNAKDCGIPQNRERVFCVSILKDFDDGTFHFNEPFDNGVRLKDMLETEVDEKYYLEAEKVEKLILSSFNQARTRIQTGDTCGTLFARDYKDPKCIPVAGPGVLIYDDYNNRIKADQSCINTLTTNCGTTAERNGVKIIVKEATKQGFAIAQEGDSINLEHPDSRTRRGRVGKGVAQTLTTSCNQAVVEPNELKIVGRVEAINGHGLMKWVYSEDGCSPTINTMSGGNREPKVLTNYRIRKLTPTECFRLMGLNNQQIAKIQNAGISNSQQYKMAGNSIVVHQMSFLANLPGIAFKSPY